MAAEPDLTRRAVTSPHVVSLTPTAVARDSRSFKQAASVGRLGYRSVLVEGLPSKLDRTKLPFELRTSPQPRSPDPPSLLRKVGRLLRSFVARRIPAVWTAGQNLWRFGPNTAASLPRAALYYLHAPHQYTAIWLRSWGRTPFVYDAHDFYPASYESPPAGHALWFKVLLWLERRCVRNAAQVVTVTGGCADLIEEFFGRRPVVIPNVHDPRIDEAPAQSLRAVIGLGDDDFLLVMTGNAKAGTAIEEMLDALLSLPSDVHLALVGAGWEQYAGAVEARQLGARVHLREGVPPNQVAPFIASADVAVILYLPHTANYVHSLPNRFFTAIAAGLPVLYPIGLPDLRSFAEQHQLGIPIDPTDPRSVAAAVRRFLVNDRLRSGLAANARKAGKWLTWEREEPRLEAILDAALPRT